MYRRPSLTRQVLEALRRNPEAGASELFIFSDGPRDAEAAPAVEEVRELCQSVEGFAKVTLVAREGNWGLAQSVIAGVTQVCASHGRVIVLEDDLIVSPHFLAYMNEALERYAEAEPVMQISGHLFPVPWEGEADAAFLPMTTSWGWATWQRAWAAFDAEMTGFERLAGDRTLQMEFDLNDSYPYFQMLKNQRQGKVDSWAIRWWLSVFWAKGMTLFPGRSLVQNIGFDVAATHGFDGRNLEGDFSDFSVRNFPEVSVNLVQFDRVGTFLAGQNKKSGFLCRLVRLVKRSRSWFSL